MTPTPETHRYVGMWRPPFGTVFPENRQHPADGFRVICECGSGAMTMNEVREAEQDAR